MIFLIRNQCKIRLIYIRFNGKRNIDWKKLPLEGGSGRIASNSKHIDSMPGCAYVIHEFVVASYFLESSLSCQQLDSRSQLELDGGLSGSHISTNSNSP